MGAAGRLFLLIALLVAGVAPWPTAHGEGVALTFDDLPLNGDLAPGQTRVQVVDEVLAILRMRAVPQVYGFANAAKLEGSEDAAAALMRWTAGGQALGNHTYGHPDLHRTSIEEFIADVRRDEPVLELLDPHGAWRWFRYPYLREGETRAKRTEVRARLGERGYRIAEVTLDYEDYLWNSAHARCLARGDNAAIARLRATYLHAAAAYLDAGRQASRLVFGRDVQHVLLLHLGSFSGTILPDLLDLLKDKGFTLVTLAEAESDPAYAADVEAASSFDGTLLEQLVDARGLVYPAVPPKPYRELEAICR